MRIFHRALLAFFIVTAASPLCLGGEKSFCEVVLLKASGTQSLNAEQNKQIHSYLSDTLNSLEKMRGESGLLKDTIEIQFLENGRYKVNTLNEDTSPTNMAVDLLVQANLVSRPEYSEKAMQNISRVLSVLNKVEYHERSGLFYSRYSASDPTVIPDRSVSSVDNIHLAIALYTIRENFKGSYTGALAGKLFSRMDFSIYYDPQSQLVGGNLKHENRHWTREAYNFSNLGSEARLLYTAGWAQALYGKGNYSSAFAQNSIPALKAEIEHSTDGDLLKLWDGSAFQLFFPKMFLNEELYSPSLKELYRAAGIHMIAEGLRRNLPVPAAHSPGAAMALGPDAKMKFGYGDKVGNKTVVSSDNTDVTQPHYAKDWESVFTPYALFMAATTNPATFLPIFSKIENLGKDVRHLYLPGMGWMDGYYVQGDLTGQVVPAQLSLNQAMIALSLFQMLDPDGLSLSSRTLFNDAPVRKRLQFAYEILDGKIKGAGTSH